MSQTLLGHFLLPVNLCDVLVRGVSANHNCGVFGRVDRQNSLDDPGLDRHGHIFLPSSFVGLFDSRTRAKRQSNALRERFLRKFPEFEMLTRKKINHDPVF